MFGFELLWKIVVLHFVTIAMYCILRLKNMEEESEKRRKDCWQTSNTNQNDPQFCVSIQS